MTMEVKLRCWEQKIGNVWKSRGKFDLDGG
jgi:hypothetical protein